MRRLASAFLLLVMVNVTALGSGLLSIPPLPSGDASAQAMPNMAGMDMHRLPGNDGSHGNDRCRLPWAPGCTSMAPCGPVALTASAPTSPRAAGRHFVPVAMTYLAPASVDEAPDHPPPRGLATLS